MVSASECLLDGCLETTLRHSLDRYAYTALDADERRCWEAELEANEEGAFGRLFVPEKITAKPRSEDRRSPPISHGVSRTTAHVERLTRPL